MKSTFALSAIVAAVAVFSQAAVAQSASSPTRAEVKSEAKKGSLAPAGEAAGNNAQKAEAGKASTTTRDQRKSTTQADAKSGNLAPAGEAAGANAQKSEASKASTTDRATRKSTTASAAKSGQLTPAGEAAQPAAEKPKK